MFKIHKKIKYALIALKEISSRKKGCLTSAKEIAEKYDIPFDPTSRVLQLMAQHGLVTAAQGAHGGYQLTGDIGAVSVYDLSRMVVGGLSVTDCSATDGACSRLDNCVLKQAMAGLNTRVIKAFKDVMVGEMI
jgi:Rrf2 family protein